MPKLTKPNKISHSKHFRERTKAIEYIIIHCSTQSPNEQLKILDELGLSVHYIIGKDGTVVQNLPPEKVAFHAGLSKWKDSKEKSLNDVSIGIELESANMGQKKGDFSRSTMFRLNILLKELCYKYKIRKENILGHSDIAPTRKPDPGAGFEWHKLYRNKLVCWYGLASLHPETDERKLLKIIGYDTKSLVAARYAFCRHFYPEEVRVVKNIQKLLDNPYPKAFKPKDNEKYIRILRATAFAIEKERKKRYWYLEK